MTKLTTLFIESARERWYSARKTVTNNAALDVEREHAHAVFDLATQQFIRSLHPLESDGEYRPELWHDRDIAGYAGLCGALDALKGHRSAETQLPVDELAEIGRAAEEMASALPGTADEPPLGVEPWEPTPPEERREMIRELAKDTPGLDPENVGDWA